MLALNFSILYSYILFLFWSFDVGKCQQMTMDVRYSTTCVNVSSDIYPLCDIEDIQKDKYMLCLKISNDILCDLPRRNRQILGEGHIHYECSVSGLEDPSTRFEFLKDDVTVSFSGPKYCLTCANKHVKDWLSQFDENVDDKNMIKGKCDGDESYCNEFKCKNSECYCSKISYDEVPELLYNGEWTRDNVMSVGYGKIFKTRKVKVNSEKDTSEVSRQYEKSRKKQNDNKRRSMSSVTWNQPHLRVFNGRLNETHVMITVGDKSKFLECSKDSCSFQIEDSWLTSEADLKVSVYILMNLDYQEQFSVSSVSICRLPDCVFCEEMSKNFYCIPTGLKALLICGGIVMILLILVIMMIIIRSFCCCTDSMPKFEISVREVQVACLMCLMVCGSCCDNSLIISSEMNSCLKSLNSLECSVNINSLISLPVPGFTTCLEIQDSEQERLMGRITVKFLTGHVRAPTERQYFTSNWQPASFSERICRGSDGCDSTSDCTTSYPDLTMGGTITGPITRFPGESSCQDSCGCAGCGCFLCSSACTYARWGVEPIPSQAQVFSIKSVYHRPEIEVCYDDLVSPLQCNSFIPSTSDTELVINANFSATILGSLQSHDISFGSTKLITSETSHGAVFGFASDPGQLLAGVIGDVQSSTIQGFLNPTATSFRVAKDLVKENVAGGTVTHIFADRGIHTLQRMPALPTMSSGVLWGIDSAYLLMGIDPSPGTVLVRLVSKIPIKYKQIVNEVCPKVNFVNVSGCYSCSTGFSVWVSAKSDCLEGISIVTDIDEIPSLNIITASIELTQSYVYLKLIMKSETKHVTTTIEFRSGKNTDTIDLTVSLDEPPDLVGEDGEIIVRNGTDSGSIGFFDDLSIGGKIGFSLGIGIGSIILILIAALLIYSMILRSRGETLMGKLIPKKSEENNEMFKEDEELTDEKDLRGYSDINSDF